MSWRFSAIVLMVFLPVVGSASVVACSDPPEKPPVGGGGPPILPGGGGIPTGEGGVPRDGGDGGRDGGEGGVCNDLVNAGQVIDRVGIVGEPPVARGGVVADGTYSLTDYTVYVGAGGIGGPTGLTAKATIRITGTKLEELFESGGSGNPSVRTTTSGFSAAGATFAITGSCGVLGTRQFQFTSNDPVLTLTDLASKEAFTFTKR